MYVPSPKRTTISATALYAPLIRGLKQVIHDFLTESVEDRIALYAPLIRGLKLTSLLVIDGYISTIALYAPLIRGLKLSVGRTVCVEIKAL